MEENSPTTWMPMKLLQLLAVLFLLLVDESQGQQAYVNDKQSDCEKNFTNTLGFVCNGVSNSCVSYLTFRSSPTYNSPVTIGYLLNANASQIAHFNNISDVDTFPSGILVVVPVNCSCAGRSFYQHNASYVLKTAGEIYLTVANNIYQTLTTCQSMIAQNPYNYRRLAVGSRLQIPLRCACPTANQTADGFKYLLTYPIAEGDSVQAIGDKFGGVGAKDILDANELSTDHIFFSTSLLVPLKTEPVNINTSSPPPSPQPPPPFPDTPTGDDDKSSKKWVYVGVGIGAGFLLLISLSGFLVLFLRRRRSSSLLGKDKQTSAGLRFLAPPSTRAYLIENRRGRLNGVRSAIESLTIYKFKDLQKATEYFAEANRIKRSVYRGSFKGDAAAIKMTKGDVSGEINMLKQINHSNIIRLSGFCIYDGNTYLVYEYAKEGSVSDWLHSKMTNRTFSWKQRVQIAHDVADALNYLHNYTNPPYIHKNLKSSNVLLDANTRAKVSNFGLARSLESGDDEGGAQLTRHVVGTHGYMAPEYIENGLITPKLDVFAFGVVMLELLSGREAIAHGDDHRNEEEELLSATINGLLCGENVREKLKDFIDPCLREEYPLDLAYLMAQLAKTCVAQDLNSRPAMGEVLETLSKIRSSSMDWDPSDELGHTR